MRKYSDPEWRFHHQLFVDTRDSGWLTSRSSHLGGFWPFVNIHCETGVFPGKSVSSVKVVLCLTKEVIFNQAFLNGTFLDSWSSTVHVFRYQSAGDKKKVVSALVCPAATSLSTHARVETVCTNMLKVTFTHFTLHSQSGQSIWLPVAPSCPEKSAGVTSIPQWQLWPEMDIQVRGWGPSF